MEKYFEYKLLSSSWTLKKHQNSKTCEIMGPLYYSMNNVNDDYRQAVWNLIREIERNVNPKREVLEQKLKAIMALIDRYCSSIKLRADEKIEK